MSSASDGLVPAPQSVAAAGLASQYGFSVLVLRWVATWIDFAVLLSIFVLPAYLFGNAVYRQLLPLWLLLVAAYFPVMEGLWGKSAGKFITCIRVVNASGGTPSFLQTVARTLLRLLEVNPILLGGLPAAAVALCTPSKQRIGDLLAGTYVLKDSDVRRLRAPPA